eukprot:CAMPEP_0181189110 /NCGR_PEP_ID=MMETSP1096-20121128/11486_1 /TAXON_ID=156174 ORGANISM="Chrysochromulina ericina, Strain CCMP281" /NCGR_SAMPLE_ID=MMETSP1096 /ASSEMBLY_ACC=CAM_ASM_000453 /LENGTH=191 /DNA_ID=CAMNT_0023278239 /DNA_START=1223 /DNA_END=1798 /DNA_ORIENTATION=-
MCAWSDPAEGQADLGGVGTTRVMHRPHDMVTLGIQDLWAAGVGPKWALRLPGQCTRGWADNHLTRCRSPEREGGDSAKAEATSRVTPAIEVREPQQEEQQKSGDEKQTKMRTKKSAASGAAALRMIGSDGWILYGQEWNDGRGAAEEEIADRREAAEKVMGERRTEVPKKEKSEEEREPERKENDKSKYYG